MDPALERTPAGLPAAAAAGVLELAPYGACIVRDGRVAAANRWLREFAGATGVPRPARVGSPGGPRARRRASWPRGQPPRRRPRIIRLPDPSGGWRFFELRAGSLLLDEGPAVQALLLDVTERVRAEDRLRAGAAALEQVEPAAADLRRRADARPDEPGLGRRELPGPRAGRRGAGFQAGLCEALRGSLAKARRILADARTYLKVLELGGVAPEPVELGALAATTVESLRLLAEAKGQRVTVTVDGAGAAQADPLLQEALWQLLANAVKYGPADSEIEIVVRGGPAVRIEVRDRGPGVPAADRERIFHRYERVDKGPIAGVGLGLSIATRILRLHGGDLRVEDHPGGGSRFIAEFPSERPSTQPQRAGELKGAQAG